MGSQLSQAVINRWLTCRSAECSSHADFLPEQGIY